jgi:elongation factor P--(R)-beta-lysine ligase
MAKSPPFWRPGVHAARRPFLLQRSRIAAAVRSWFELQGFLEVDTAALQVSPGNETHLHAFATELIGPGGERRELYLRTSPEFACKKLLTAGETRIFDFAKVFRNRECGALHHAEFTLLEWYRANEPYEILIEDCAALLRVAAQTTGARSFTFRGRSIDPFLPPERITVAEAFAKFAGIDLLATVSGHQGDRNALAAQAQKADIRTASDDTWADVLSRVIVEKVEPQLGNGRASILYEYPLPQSALARAKPGSSKVAERFELYACGVELANAFAELTDPNEQRVRFQTAMEEKARIYGEHYPIDEDFLAALEHMPPASGIALGFDRLVMLAASAERIEQVIWTPVVEADE